MSTDPRTSTTDFAREIAAEEPLTWDRESDAVCFYCEAEEFGKTFDREGFIKVKHDKWITIWHEPDCLWLRAIERVLSLNRVSHHEHRPTPTT